MSSGLYSAVSGAVARMQMMDTITDNLSNGQTNGFKKGGVAFEALLEQPPVPGKAQGVDYAEIKDGFTDFSQGTLTRTDIPTQFAIEGKGFFKVQDGSGQQYFTREGSLRRDQAGHLVTPEGMAHLGEDNKPLVVPAEGLEIDEQGVAQLPDGTQVKIPLYTFPETSALERVGGGMFKAANPATATQVAKPRIYQGYVEDSNVNTMHEMGRMMEALRVFEACQKLMKNYRDLDNKAIDLGTVG